MTVSLTAIQMRSKPDVMANLVDIEQQLSELDITEQHLVLLPECCLYFGGKDKDQLSLAHDAHMFEAMIEGLAHLAQTFGVYLTAGSVPMASPVADKFTNASLVIDPQGQVIADYQKLHLFDVEVADSEKNYRESRYTQAGRKVVNCALPFANLGLTICYDLRFPELFRQLTENGADIITVPAAFTRVTGKAHWQSLLQARAIENQVYIMAAGQEGIHANGRETWGHSMIINPWGEVLTTIDQGVGAVTATFEPEFLQEVRRNIPVAQHNRFTTELI
ncbi:carbon-nitrogen hydrolase family protein [Thalassotalea euphylliae]|uniref:carbon-nitrogen hydrolase family protein n=1 Tax=Thalassotalea euphylliae TaxID=1655234 RepID=UPI0036330300